MNSRRHLRSHLRASLAKALGVGAILFFHLLAANSSARTWQLLSGKTLEGDFLEDRPPNIHILEAGRHEIVRPESDFCQRDRDFAEIAETVVRKSYLAIGFRILEMKGSWALCEELRDDNPQFNGELFAMYVGKPELILPGETARRDLHWCGTADFVRKSGTSLRVRYFASELNAAVSIRALEWHLPEPVFDPAAGTILAPGEVPKTNDEIPRREVAWAQADVDGTGTCFALTEQGHLVTNYHVIRGAVETRVIMNGKTFPATCLVADPGEDLAILKIDAVTVPLPIFKEHQAELGEKVFVGGFPNPDLQGVRMKMTSGIINSLAGLHDDPHQYQIDAAVQPGSSGGPVIDEKGRVLGIVQSRLDAMETLKVTGQVPENVNYAIKVEQLTGLIEKVPNLAGLLDGQKPGAAASIGKALEASTYLVCVILQNHPSPPVAPVAQVAPPPPPVEKLEPPVKKEEPPPTPAPPYTAYHELVRFLVKHPMRTVTSPPLTPESFQAMVDKTQRMAVAAFPDLGIAGTRMNREFLEYYEARKNVGDAALQYATWPADIALTVGLVKERDPN